MEFSCPHCQQVIEYAHAVPRFCSHCGASLTDGQTADVTATLDSSRPLSTPRDIPIRLAGYRLLGQLGKGGMGVVYEAEQEETGRRVAIKLLPRQVRRTDETAQRFLREGELAAALSHPRSTFVYAAGEDDGQFYIVMELMPGGTLKDVVEAEGKLPIARAVDYLLDVIEGLEAAHAVGVIHRDVKPSNCFVDRHGRAKVGDYGLSKSLISDAGLTRTGAFMGTPLFAAPEQIKGGRIDERTDVYAVGATLFHLIAGEGPFQGDAARVIAGIAAETAPSLRTKVPEVPRQLDRLIAKTLEKAPEKRPKSLAALRSALVPFSTRGSSIADLGRRIAAYFIDTIVASVAASIVSGGVVVAILSLSDAETSPEFLESRECQVSLAMTTTLLLLLYFAVTEGRYGRGVGKWMMRMRVVGSVGEPPGIARGILRSLFIPGLMLTCTQILPIVLGLGFAVDIDSVTITNWALAMVQQQLYPVLGWLLTLGCLATMRRQNSYRGIHEIASGTRVVRWQPEEIGRNRGAVPVTLPHRPQVLPPVSDAFDVLGEMSVAEHYSVLYANDKTLGRPVWIVTGRGAKSLFPPARISVARATRPFWLQAGTPEQDWEAIEAIRGAPIGDVVESVGTSWQEARELLSDLVLELSASLEDGTLPSQLSIGQVWVDSNWRLKLIDVAMSHGRSDAPASEQERPDEERAVSLLRDVVQVLDKHVDLPAHALDFFEQLQSRALNRDTLTWAAQQLQQMTERPSTLRWDDRLGAMAVSACTEMVLYSTVVFILSALLTLVGMPAAATLLASFGFGLALPVALGFFLSGGPVFRLTGIQVRSAKGGPAGRGQCGWRSAVAWAPMVLGYCLLATWVSWVVSVRGNVTFESGIEAFQYGFTILAALVLLAIHSIGALGALVFPRRGVQDLLSGTRLVPS